MYIFDGIDYELDTSTSSIIEEETKEVPFYKPVITLENEDIDIDLVTLDNGYIITKKVSAEDPYKDHKIPTIFIDQKVMIESNFIMDYKAKTSDEVCLFYLLNKVDSQYPLFHAYGYYITDQEVTTVEVEADGKDNRRYFTYLQENYPEQFNTNLHRKIVPVHSHHSMGNGWSGVDLKQQNSKGDMGFCDDYRFYGVYTLKDKMRFSYINYFPVYFRIEDINLGIKVHNDGISTILTKERKEELIVIVNDLVKPKKIKSVIQTTSIANWVNPYSNYVYNNTKKKEDEEVVTKFINTSTHPINTNLDKYKMLNFMEKAYKTIKEFREVVEFAKIKKEVAISTSNEIYSGLVENIPNMTLTTAEVITLRKHCYALGEYLLDEFANNTMIPDTGELDEIGEDVPNYTLLLSEAIDSINEWVDDPETSILKLNAQLVDKNLNQAIFVFDEIILDGLKY